MKSEDSDRRGRNEKPADARQRGLPSVAEARAARRRFWRAPARFWIWSAVVVAAGFIFWWKQEEGAIQSARSELLARQRAAVAELGPRWFPLRDKIETWTAHCAGVEEPLIDEQALAGWDFRSLPGIYLRLAQQDARSPERIREAARRSLRDGFTACFMRAANPSPLAGPACKSSKDCPPRQHCNEFGHCAEYHQPYNLRLAYKTMWLLTDEWVDEIKAITTELTMRGATVSFNDWNTYDIPVAAELLTQAKYFLVVVDEPVSPDGTPLGAGGADRALPPADAPDEDEERDEGELRINRTIPSAPHRARVCAWRLEDGRGVLAIQRNASGRLVGGEAGLDALTLEARRRQANSCSLALEVREALGDETATELPE